MKKISQLAIPYIVWMVLMLVLPMALIAMYSVTQHGNSIISFSLTLEHYKKFFTDSDFLLILGRSLMIAFKTTVICLLIGYPAAYFISRSEERIQSLLIMAITIPTWINMLVRTYAWIGLLSEGGIIQQILKVLGFGQVELLYTEAAVLLGMVYNFIPFKTLFQFPKKNSTSFKDFAVLSFIVTNLFFFLSSLLLLTFLVIFSS